MSDVKTNSKRTPAHEVTQKFFEEKGIQFMINLKPQQVRQLKDGALLIEKPEANLILGYKDEFEAAKEKTVEPPKN